MKNIMNKIKDFMVGPEYDEDDDDRLEDNYEEEEAAPRPVKDVYAPKQIRKERGVPSSVSDKVVSIHNSVHMEVVIVYPKTVDDTNSISQYLKENKTVVVNMEEVERGETQRIVDFLCGVTYALEGEFQSISSRIFIAAPHCVDITGQFKDELKSSGVILPWVSSAMK